MTKKLTSAQARVLDGLLRGSYTPEVAESLAISRQAVENHMKNLRRRGLLTTATPDGWSRRNVDGGVVGLTKGEKKLTWVAVMDAPRLNRFDKEPVGWAVFVHIGHHDPRLTVDKVFILPRSARRVTFLQVSSEVCAGVSPELTPRELQAEITQAVGVLTGLEAVLPAWTVKEEA